MKFTSIFRLALAIITLKTLQAADPQTGDGKLATKDDEEVDFSIPQLDPRNPFYKGRPANTFGTHAKPTQRVDEIRSGEDFPTPVKFYERYIKQYKPVVMRGMAKQSPAYHLWTEEYLKEMYGDLTVRLEARSEDNSRIPSGIGGMGRDTVGNFLDRYQMLDGYVISQLPSPMEADIAFPPFLTCGSLAQGVQEVHLFLSAKGGKTLLHRDPYSSVHCVYNGTKQWLVVDPKQKDKLYMSEDSRFEFGGYSEINVNDVHYETHPKIKELEFARVILNKGDCIYMPSGYPHQVRSKGYMNSAVSIWFSHFLDFDPNGCDDSENLFQPMSESSVLWRYSGQGDLSQGHMDVHVLRTVMRTAADDDGVIWLQDFVNNFIQGELNGEEAVNEQRFQFIQKLATGGKSFITVDELDAISMATLKELVEVVDPSDISNKNDFEYNHITTDSIWGIFSMLRGTNPSQVFTHGDFIKIYTIYLGGTEAVAKEILSVLDPNNTDQITGRMVMQNGDEAFEKFDKGFKHDATIEHLWYKHFVAKDLFRKYGITHFDYPGEELLAEESTEVEERCDMENREVKEEMIYVDNLDDVQICDGAKEKELTDANSDADHTVSDEIDGVKSQIDEHDEL